MQHSRIVGGSTAKRVINCPGSVALVQKMPPQVESKYAAEGTMLHGCMDELLASDSQPATFQQLVKKHNLTDEQQEKLEFCTAALDEIDPHAQMTFVQEVEIQFEGVKELEGVFGNADLVGRLGDRAVVLDWKFGDGVAVDAEENSQGLFYAAAAKKTSTLSWAIEGTKEVEIVIVQPPYIRRWVTTWDRVDEFERELIRAVKIAARDDAPTSVGDHCRWCTAKPICPSMTGAIDRAVHTKLESLSPQQLGAALTMASRLESFINDARQLAQQRLEKGMPVEGYKLVPKRATRQWVDEAKAAAVLGADFIETKPVLLSPAQAEKVLKKRGLALPSDLVVAVSSGNTIAPQDDPRPAVMVLGEQLKSALNRLQ